MTIRSVGIDPGLYGALVVLDAGGPIIQQAVLPTLPAGRGRRTYDVPALVRMLEGLAKDGEVFVTLEQALVFRGQGLASTASGVGGQRLIEGVLAALRIRHQVVHPRSWQRALLPGFRAGDSKSAARVVAGRLWPAESWRRTPACTRPHQGMIDAALLAEYGRRTFCGIVREGRPLSGMVSGRRSRDTVTTQPLMEVNV